MEKPSVLRVTIAFSGCTGGTLRFRVPPTWLWKLGWDLACILVPDRDVLGAQSHPCRSDLRSLAKSWLRASRPISGIWLCNRIPGRLCRVLVGVKRLGCLKGWVGAHGMPWLRCHGGVNRSFLLDIGVLEAKQKTPRSCTRMRSAPDPI